MTANTTAISPKKSWRSISKIAKLKRPMRLAPASRPNKARNMLGFAKKFRACKRTDEWLKILRAGEQT